MTKETQQDEQYPVRSLHDFLEELDREYTKFRNGTLIGLASSGILFLIVVVLILRIRHYGLGLLDFILLIIAAVFLGYSVYAMYGQYRFLAKWERRIGLIRHTEDRLLQEKIGEDQQGKP
jgi:hypothetical protein